MALGTINITTTLIRNALGAAINNVFGLCTHANVNKWSRYKPIRDAGTGVNVPAGSNGKFGLNLPTNWDYLQPRGGSPGGSPDEPGRMGDFRGYEHDKDVAGPVIFVVNTDVDVPNITPTLLSNTAIGEWFFNKNSTHESVRITPSDLGLNGYYYGVKLSFGAVHYYKTGAAVSAATNQEFHFEAQITSLSSNTFNNFPNYDYRGTVTWTLFISSTQATSWTTTAPSDIIVLPSGTYGSKTVVSTGTFTLLDWIIPSADGSTQVVSYTFPYNHSGVSNAEVFYLYKPGDANHMGIYAGCISAGLIGGHWSWEAWIGGNNVSTDYDAWDTGVEIKIFPYTANNSSAINANAQFGISSAANGGTIANNVSIALTHEDGTPPTATWRSDNTDFSMGTNIVESGLAIDSTNLNLTIGQLTDLGIGFPEDIPLYIFRDLAESVLLHSSNVHFASDGSTTPEQNFTLSSAIDPGDDLVIRLGNAV
jgi:hypothetical protein